MKLGDLHEALPLTLRGLSPVATLAATLGQPPARVALYRDFVRGHMDGILAKLFPQTIARLVAEGAEPEVLIGSFAHEHPPRHRDLNLAGEPFPGFLAARGHGFAAALAQLEWELFAAAVHPATPRTGDGALNPTLSLFAQRFPAVQCLAQGTPETDPAELEPPQVVMVFRRPSNHAVSFRVLDAAMARVITGLSHGSPVSPDDLAEARELGLVTAGA